jgi:hydroxymethylbilane synthase
VIRLGTRGSRLARTQSGVVADAIAATIGPVETVVIRSEGDDTLVALDAFVRPGAFVAALEDALLAGRVDVVVHSYKDLPSASTPGLVVAAVPLRAGVADVLVALHGMTLADLPPGATVGTSSPRRSAAVLRARPDLTVVPLRGNVDTRLRAVSEGRLDAVVLAQAGLERLGVLTEDMTLFGTDVMLPAPAQGALAVQCRADDPLAERLAGLDDACTRLCVTAERTVLAEIEAACTTAVGALARTESGWLTLEAEIAEHRGVLFARHGDRVEVDGGLEAAEDLGRRVGRILLEDAR